ncbi:hypothetical protein [Pollutimonas bauzanensis]|uniref:Phage abortive infection protein n=1 Tax=Pollutimonas bauzanensis TaxID=658167 RepID=A0A1M5Q2H8_9BURK|nr:hypothetical protein [Pollutimonas bauzanensis]SHH08248.1 hypothetical protein SAMN04488135_102138 [Pollutimonas bauzanensis]
MINGTLCAAVFAIFLTTAAYLVHFFLGLGYKISSESSDWGQFGDYFGGVLNPILSFIAIILLIKSLNFQNEANISLRDQLKNNEKVEMVRTFSVLFFNVIVSQKTLLKDLQVNLGSESSPIEVTGTAAILKVEREVEDLRNRGADNAGVTRYLEQIDNLDHIFGMLRSFYVAVKLVSDRLSDENGFDISDRQSQYLALVNLTDFAQIRLILMGIQFMKCHYSSYMKGNHEFLETLESVNLRTDLY